MIWTTLFLVVLRCAVFVLLILYGRYFCKKKAKPGKPTGDPARPGVSVLIPAYNEEENIRGTIESIIRSPYPRKEVIVIDDGSTDSTGEVVKRAIADRPEEAIRLVQVKNGGKARALNHGIEAAHFDICVVVDADAVLDPQALYHFVEHFDDPEIGAVAGKVRTTGSNRFLDIFQTLEYAIGQNIDKRAFSVVNAVGVVPGPAGAWSKPFVMEAGGFDTDTLVEDQDMTLRLLRMGKKVAYEHRAVAYTETPHTVKNFLKQRFRWVYGTMQCFWKNKAVFIERPTSAMSLVVMPNIFIFNIILPLTYPFADSALLFGIIFSDWQSLVVPFVLFTAFDLLYAWFGVYKEPKAWRTLYAVPLQRIVYRQLLYYTVAKSVIRALEGTGSSWDKFTKVGETQRFYFTSVIEKAHSSQEIPDAVTLSFQGPSGTIDSSMNRHKVAELSVIPRQSHNAGEISSPAWAPNELVGVFDEPKT